MHKDLEDQTEEEEDQESRCSHKEGGMTIDDFSNTYLPTYNKLQLRFSYLLASHPWNFHEPLMVLTIVNGVIFLPLDNLMSNGTTQFKRIAVEKGLIIPFCFEKACI